MNVGGFFVRHGHTPDRLTRSHRPPVTVNMHLPNDVELSATQHELYDAATGAAKWHWTYAPCAHRTGWVGG